MKHLFYVHSYITYFVSLEVIKYKQLNHADCVFMYGRGFRPAMAGAVSLEVDLPFTHYPQSSFPIERQFWKSWTKLATFDKYIRGLTQDLVFHIYTNQTGLDFIRLFISHRNCRGFSFIEEGLYSYYSFDFINTELCPPVGKPSFFYRLLILLNYVGRLEQQKYFLTSGYAAVYGISTKAFPDFRNRNIMPFPFNKVANESTAAATAVLVLDSFLEYGIITWKQFEKALEEIFQYLQEKGYKKLLIRFHPKQYEDAAQLSRSKNLIDKFKKNITVVEVTQDQSLEELASDPGVKNLSFYVFLSSAALYAALCGRKAYSFALFLAEDDATYRQCVDEVPRIFKDLVHFIPKP